MIESCDSGVRKLAEACGWLQELEELWAKTARDEKPAAPKEEVKKSRDELLEDEVDKLTREVDESLRLGKAQHDWLDKHVDKKIARIPDDEKDKESSAASLEPTDDPDSKVLAPVSNPGVTKTDPGGGLGHVFPHMKKPSL
jgi:NAD-dependent histone deacetylase SIR2